MRYKQRAIRSSGVPRARGPAAGTAERRSRRRAPLAGAAGRYRELAYGRAIKTPLQYRRRFWRQEGFSGDVDSDLPSARRGRRQTVRRAARECSSETPRARTAGIEPETSAKRAGRRAHGPRRLPGLGTGSDRVRVDLVAGGALQRRRVDGASTGPRSCPTGRRCHSPRAASTSPVSTRTTSLPVTWGVLCGAASGRRARSTRRAEPTQLHWRRRVPTGEAGRRRTVMRTTIRRRVGRALAVAALAALGLLFASQASSAQARISAELVTQINRGPGAHPTSLPTSTASCTSRPTTASTGLSCGEATAPGPEPSWSRT